MKPLKRLCLWYGLLTKRIVKQKVFLAILLLIPLMACAIHLMPSHDGGIITVALVQLGDDEFSSAIVHQLTDSNSVIKYHFYETEEAATQAVEAGRCDAAWIFREDAELQVAKFAAGRSTDGAVTVIERENSATLSLTRECLFIAMYPYIAYGTYSDFLGDLSEGESVSVEALDRYYNVKERRNSLIDYYYVDGTRQETGNLLVAPVRGLLSMVLLLAALASCMYACRDEQKGVFEHLGGRRGAFVPLFCHITAIVPTALASLIALYVSGLWTNSQRELLTMALYVLSLAAFCEILRILCRSEVTLGALIPVLMTLMLVLCPVFLHVDQVHALQYSLPPFYYLNALLQVTFLPKFAIYTLAVCLAAAAAVLIKKRCAD